MATSKRFSYGENRRKFDDTDADEARHDDTDVQNDGAEKPYRRRRDEGESRGSFKRNRNDGESRGSYKRRRNDGESLDSYRRNRDDGESTSDNARGSYTRRRNDGESWDDNARSSYPRRRNDGESWDDNARGSYTRRRDDGESRGSYTRRRDDGESTSDNARDSYSRRRDDGNSWDDNAQGSYTRRRDDGDATTQRHDDNAEFPRDGARGSFQHQRPGAYSSQYEEEAPALPYARPHRIVVFGGSFDPVHNAHLMLAQTVLDKELADEILFIPAKVQPLKPNGAQATAEQRLEMLRLALEGHDNFSYSDIEIQRASDVSYTYDTINVLSRVFPDCKVSLLIGMDSFRTLATWYRAPELIQHFDFMIYPRPGILPPSLPDLEKTCGVRNAVKLFNSILPEEDFKVSDISATTIREALAKGRPIDSLVPEAVAKYIKDNGLYR